MSQLQFIATPTARECSTKVRLIAIPGDRPGGRPYLVCRKHTIDNRMVNCRKTLENGRWVGDCLLCEVYESLYQQIDRVRRNRGNDEDLLRDARTIKPIERYFYLAVDRDNEDKGVCIFSQGKMVTQIILGGTIGEPGYIREPVKRFHCSCCKKHIMRRRKERRSKWSYRLKKWVKRKWNDFLIWKGWRQPPDLTPFSVLHGRDLVINRRMKGPFPDYNGYFIGRSPLGTPEQIQLWTAQAAQMAPDVQKLVESTPELSDLEIDVARQYNHLPRVYEFLQSKGKPIPIDEV